MPHHHRQPRVLLVQRAAHDSSPLRWELPGGAVDADDPTVLHGLAREVAEETGLRVRHVRRVVPVPGTQTHQVFWNSARSKLIGRFVFEVEIETAATGGRGVADGGPPPVVVLDEREHRDFVWATEGEVRDVVLEAFRLGRGDGEDGEDGGGGCGGDGGGDGGDGDGGCRGG
ncbi:hypothetical protein E4U41_006238 [Claviceps citrina]|nr:hypothetical protein E4U41_006238 [Claviceps citrina]